MSTFRVGQLVEFTKAGLEVVDDLTAEPRARVKSLTPDEVFPLEVDVLSADGQVVFPDLPVLPEEIKAVEE